MDISEGNENDSNLYKLRKSVINYVTSLINNVCNTYDILTDTTKKDRELFAVKFETDLYNNMSTYDYIKFTPVNLCKCLNFQNGLFPDELVIIQYITNKITIQTLMCLDINKSQDCRNEMICAFINLLYKYCKDKDRVRDLATKIEVSCFNAVIKNSKHLEDPPCRQWTSPVFKEMYSNRCGIILNLINPNSTSNKEYNSNLLNLLLSNDIDPKLVGYIQERQLCPQALQKEKDEIEIRSEQHLIEKESNLFKCPNCKERRVTYREVQLRAIDEAPDYLCKCLNCKHRFKGR